jgi:NAD(P)H-flavin reductase
MSTASTETMVALPPDPFIPQIYRVDSVCRELGDTVTLELMPLGGKRPAYQSGQFNMLYVPGIGEAAISISGNPVESTGFVHTIRAAGAVSTALTLLKVGAKVGLRGPFGVGWPEAAAEGADVVIVAGGLGMAPLRPAIYNILANRGRYGRVAVLSGSRNPNDILYRPELELWRQRLDLDITVTVDHADVDWRGNVGVVSSLVPRTAFNPHNAVAMLCGPEVMMRFTANALRDAGIPADHIYLSMERNMKCAIGLCGHCQFGPDFICKDGPVMRYDRIASILTIREI